MLVKVEDIRSFNEFLINDRTNKDSYLFAKCHQNNFSWCDEPYMTDEESAVVYEGFEPLCHTTVAQSRKNSTADKLGKIELALYKIEAICNDDGIRFSRNHVPGQKEQLLTCIKLLDPSINTALSTFDSKNYVGKLNLKWRQGERKESGYAMVEAVRKHMGVI